MCENLIYELKQLPIKYTGITDVPRNVVYLMGCSQFDQFCCTLRGLLQPENFCPFCTQERQRRNRQFSKTIHGWGLLQNEFPRADSGEMWLIVPSRHIAQVNELTSYDWLAIGELFVSCASSHCVSGSMVMRYGDPHFHAGTIEHLHINVITPVPGIAFRTPLAKNEEDHEANYTRVGKFIFELRERGGFKWLFSLEGITGTQPKLMAT